MYMTSPFFATRRLLPDYAHGVCITSGRALNRQGRFEGESLVSQPGAAFGGAASGLAGSLLGLCQTKRSRCLGHASVRP
jgi:hypothetical protein